MTYPSPALAAFAPGSTANQAAVIAKRDAWVAGQVACAPLANTDGPLLALVGDMVADAAEGSASATLGHRQVADLIIRSRPDQFVCLGDNVYLQGLQAVYETEYHASYGRLKSRTWPVPGNHEMQGCLHPADTPPTVVTGLTGGETSVTLTAPLTECTVGDVITFNTANPVTAVGSVSKTVLSIVGSTYTFSALSGTVPAGATCHTVNSGHGYLAYFGNAAAMTTTKYAFWSRRNIGRWLFYTLDSNSTAKMQAGSAQLAWLAADIAANPGKPIAAVWHHPRWTDSTNPTVNDDNAYDPVWALFNATGRCQFIANGHDHNYQRFDRCVTQGINADPLTGQAAGTTQFIVGTGGYNNFECPGPVRAQFATDVYNGALFIRLGTSSWAWKYLAVDGTVVETGSQTIIGA